MIVLGILVSIAAIGTMCWLLFNLADKARKLGIPLYDFRQKGGGA